MGIKIKKLKNILSERCNSVILLISWVYDVKNFENLIDNRECVQWGSLTFLVLIRYNSYKYIFAYSNLVYLYLIFASLIFLT